MPSYDEARKDMNGTLYLKVHAFRRRTSSSTTGPNTGTVSWAEVLALATADASERSDSTAKTLKGVVPQTYALARGEAPAAC